MNYQTIDRILSRIHQYIPGELISPGAQQKIMDALKDIPLILPNAVFGFEVVLNDPEPVADFAFCISPEDARELLEYEKNLPQNSDTGIRHICRLCKKWLDEKSGYKNIIENLWVECDPGTAPTFKYFINLGQDTRKNTDPGKGMYPRITMLASFFTPNDVKKEIIVNIKKCADALPAACCISQIGFFPGKNNPVYRLCIAGLRAESLFSYLEEIGINTISPDFYRDIPRFTRFTDHFILHITLSNLISHSVGIELRLSFDDLTLSNNKRWSPLLRFFTGEGYCCKNKINALLSWNGRSYEFNHPGLGDVIVNRLLYYMKATYSPGDFRMKGYFGIIHCPLSYFHFKKNKLDRCLDNAAAYLSSHQLPTGEWPGYRADNPGLHNVKPDSTVFSNALIILSLFDLHDSHVEPLIHKGIRFLISRKLPGNIWKYWAGDNGNMVQPDLDDTCLCSFVLNKTGYNHETAGNKKIILSNTSSSGCYYTWITPTGMQNDVDLVVNTNTILYLGDIPETKSALEYILSCIKEKRERNEYWYYLDNFAFYYMISNAYTHGISRFGEIKDTLCQRLMARQNVYGVWIDPLRTACAVSTLLRFNNDYKRDLVSSVNYLIESQRLDGSWKEVAFWAGPEKPEPHSTWFGSPALTTAFCAQALALYREGF